MGFSKQEYWTGLPFPSPVDHILSELSTMTHPSWVALQGMAHSFIELDKACGPCGQFNSFSVIVVFILFALWWIRIRDLQKIPVGRDWLWGKLGLVLMGWAMLSKSLIQLSVFHPCVPSLYSLPVLLMGGAVFPPWGQTMVESEKWKWKSLSLSFFLSRFWPFATTGTIQFMEFSRPEYFEQVAFPFSRGSSQPRDRTQVSRIAGGFFPAEPPGKPQNTGMGSVSLL